MPLVLKIATFDSSDKHVFSANLLYHFIELMFYSFCFCRCTTSPLAIRLSLHPLLESPEEEAGSSEESKEIFQLTYDNDNKITFRVIAKEIGLSSGEQAGLPEDSAKTFRFLWNKARLFCCPRSRHHQFLHEKSVEADEKFFGSLHLGVHDVSMVSLQAEMSSIHALRLLLRPFSLQSSCPAVTPVTANNLYQNREEEKNS